MYLLLNSRGKHNEMKSNEHPELIQTSCSQYHTHRRTVIVDNRQREKQNTLTQ